MTTRRDDAALAQLGAEWDDLYARCPAATPFASHAWLDSWWRGYGRPGGLVVVLVRHAGRLVAAAALTRGRRAGIPVLTPVGAGISDFSDVLIDGSCAGRAGDEEAARRLARAMAVQARGGVVDLPEVAPAAAAWRVVVAWPARAWLLPASTCLELAGRPVDEHLHTLPGRKARTKRRKLRLVDAEGLDVRDVDSAGAADSVAALLRLHHLQWRGHGMTREHGRARFAAHLARAATTMIDRGEAALVEYRKGELLVCVDLMLVGPAMVGGYLAGVHPDLRHRVDVTAMLLRQNLDLTCRLGRPTLSLLRGREDNKLGWRPEPVVNHRVLLAGAGAAAGPAALYAAAAWGRARAADTVRSRFPALHQSLRRTLAG